MNKAEKLFLIMALVIAISISYSSRYRVTPYNDNASLIVDTWFWRTSLCHRGGCMEWQNL